MFIKLITAGLVQFSADSTAQSKMIIKNIHILNSTAACAYDNRC